MTDAQGSGAAIRDSQAAVVGQLRACVADAASAQSNQAARGTITRLARSGFMNSAKPSQFDALADRLPGMGRDPAAVRKRIETMERLLERMFVIPGLNRPVGLDVILDLLPMAGDLVGAALGSWMVWEARNLGMSKWQMARMFGNVGVDALLGAIPFVGAIPDFFFRSNTRNLKIIRRHLDRYHPATAIVDAA